MTVIPRERWAEVRGEVLAALAAAPAGLTRPEVTYALRMTSDYMVNAILARLVGAGLVVATTERVVRRVRVAWTTRTQTIEFRAPVYRLAPAPKGGA